MEQEKRSIFDEVDEVLAKGVIVDEVDGQTREEITWKVRWIGGQIVREQLFPPPGGKVRQRLKAYPLVGWALALGYLAVGVGTALATRGLFIGGSTLLGLAAATLLWPLYLVALALAVLACLIGGLLGLPT